MKKYLSLFSFLVMFFIGAQVSSAQTATKQQAPEVIAKQKTYELSQLLNLTGEQQGKIFKVLVDAEQNISGLKKRGDNDTVKSEGMITLNKNLDAQFKEILTPDQYETYKKSLIKDKK